MLLRDKQAKRVWHDILVWIRDNNAVLPSGEEISKDLKPVRTAARSNN